MGFIQDHEIRTYTGSFMHGIIELVPKNLRCTHNDGRSGILLAITSQDATIGRPKFMTEFLIYGIGKGLEG